jgi:hypothetical protein
MSSESQRGAYAPTSIYLFPVKSRLRIYFSPSAKFTQSRWQRRPRAAPSRQVIVVRSRFVAVTDSRIETTASLEAFPVFDDSSSEGSPSLPKSPPRPPSRPTRRRSRQVNEVDRRILFGSNKPNVFTYVDLVRCLRCPPALGYLPRAPLSQLGSESTYTRAPASQVCAFSPAPWALSRSPFLAQPGSSAQQAQTSGSRQQRTASISPSTT